ncbi:MAG: CBS domain-containing protein [Candidatus Diapherotrites archaeon]|uniref:CBS domain-containing protein n=1 Tax=Candidatus Iainarchaeum sp. TaxID=3101447 RepID=A0A8T4LIA1_9ARCH|nr:CBS domain-containing protein [Candidatus Diapherotrites archaeon]
MPGLDSNASELMRKEFVTADVEEPLTKIIGRMRQFRQDNIVITEGGRYVGMVSKREMLRKKVDFRQMKAKSVLAKYPALERGTALPDIVQAMYSSGARELAVIHKGRAIGAVTVNEVIAQMKKIPELRQLTASEVCVKNPLTLREDDNLSQAISRMKKSNVKKMPVVDGDGLLKGILRWENLMETYLLQAVEKNEVYRANVRGGHTADKQSALKVRVGGIAGTNYVVATEHESLEKIVDFMKERDAVILVKKEKPTGIITYGNLLRAFERVNVVPRNIQWVHKPELDSFEEAKVDSALAEFYDKAEKRLETDIRLEAHFKAFHAQGKRKQYLLRLRLFWAGKLAEATKEEWSPLTVVQKAIKALENGFRHRM